MGDRLLPRVMRGAVENANSSLPSIAATRTSWPVLNCPSTWSTTFCRKLFFNKAWWVSVSPNSQGSPACFTPVHELAPVPPSWPDITMCSANPFATPEAMTPTPTWKNGGFHDCWIYRKSNNSLLETRNANLTNFKNEHWYSVNFSTNLESEKAYIFDLKFYFKVYNFGILIFSCWPNHLSNFKIVFQVHFQGRIQ